MYEQSFSCIKEACSSQIFFIPKAKHGVCEAVFNKQQCFIWLKKLQGIAKGFLTP